MSVYICMSRAESRMGKLLDRAVDDRLCGMQSHAEGRTCVSLCWWGFYVDLCLMAGPLLALAPSLSGSWIRLGNCLILKSPD